MASSPREVRADGRPTRGARSQADNDFLYNLVREAGGVDGIWIGATDEAKPNTWVWQDGSPVKYANWDKGQPNNYGGEEHYVMLLVRGNTGKWWDQPNESGLGLPKAWKTGFVCEWDEESTVAAEQADDGWMPLFNGRTCRVGRRSRPTRRSNNR